MISAVNNDEVNNVSKAADSQGQAYDHGIDVRHVCAVCSFFRRWGVHGDQDDAHPPDG